MVEGGDGTFRMESSKRHAYLSEKVHCVEAEDFYGLFGVRRDVELSNLQAAYRGVLRVMTEVLAADDPVMHLAASRVRAALAQAYRVLADPAARTNYDHGRRPRMDDTATTEVSGAFRIGGFDLLELLQTSPASLGRRRVEAAEALFVRGVRELGRDHFVEAERFLSKAHELAPENPAYALKLGWAVFNSSERSPVQRRDEARPFLELALVGDPYDAETRYTVAKYWRAVGNTLQWRRELEATLRCDSAHPQALEEMALHTAGSHSSGADPRRAGARSGIRRRGLSRLFRRGDD